MMSEDQIYTEKNCIEKREHLSPSGKYRLIVETYKTGGLCNYTKGTVYSADQWVGEIRRNFPYFPFLFFQKANGNELLISGRTPYSQTIINCQTGHIDDNTDVGNHEKFCWVKIRQLDFKTICVLGDSELGNYDYRFYDLSNPSLGWPRMEVVQYSNLPLPKEDYILKHQEWNGNYLEPLIRNYCITFEVKELRVKGLANLKYRTVKDDEIQLEVKDWINLELEHYLNQLEEGDQYWVLENSYQSSVHRQTKAQTTFTRIGNQIMLIEFLKSN